MTSAFTRITRRAAVFVAALGAVAAPRARAQGDVAATAVGVGYVVLTIGSIHRLMQSSETATVGATIRLTSVGTGGSATSLRGVLTAIDPESVTVVVDSSPRRIARADLRDMSQFAGTERKWAQGWAIGFVVLGTIGVVGGLASGDDPPGDDFAFSAKAKAVILGTIGGVMGSSLGALIGLAVEDDHWKTVDRLPPGTTAIASPAGGGRFNLGLRVPF